MYARTASPPPSRLEAPFRSEMETLLVVARSANSSCPESACNGGRMPVVSDSMYGPHVFVCVRARGVFQKRKYAIQLRVQGKINGYRPEVGNSPRRGGSPPPAEPSISPPISPLTRYVYRWSKCVATWGLSYLYSESHASLHRHRLERKGGGRW